jgi:hypothetical protein
MTTGGLGHRGIVRDPGVVDEVVRFVTGASVERRPEAERLEEELFNRELRWAC